jgi:chemotaxis signal transduction protein
MKTESRNIIDDCWNTIGIWRTSGTACEKISTYIHCRNCPVYADAGKSLLDRPIPEDTYTDAHISTTGSRDEEHAADLTAYSVFRIGNEWYAIDMKLLSEIRPIYEIHCLPHNSDPFLKGLINVNGVIVVCVSVGAILGKNKLDRVDETHQTSRLIIVSIGVDKIAFPVTESTGSIRLDGNRLGEIPAINRLSNNSMLKGMYRHKEKDIGIIDSERLLESFREHLA